MDDEQALVDISMELFRKIRSGSVNGINVALQNYLGIIPDPLLKGMAQHKARQYFKQRADKEPLSDQERMVLSAQIGQQILDELILKVRKKAKQGDEDLDGAELFYRRALNHMGMERYSDAERLLRRAVDICPDFYDAWETLIEVLQFSEKPELAEQAKLRLRELKQTI